MRNKLMAGLLAVVGACCCQVKEDLGVVVQSASRFGDTIVNLAGSPHFLTAYSEPNNVYTSHTYLWDVNMSTGVSRLIDTGHNGTFNLYGRVVSSQNGKYYTGTNDPCYVYEYDSVSGALTLLNSPSWQTAYCGLQGTTSDKSAYTATEGAPGHLFFGTAVRGMIFQYDTNTSTMTDYGVISPPGGNPTCNGCYRYVATIQADANYIYAGMRDASTNEWWLTTVKISDGTQTECFTSPYGTGGSVTRRVSDNAIVYQHNSTWYLMPTDGTCPSETISPDPTVNPWYWLVGNTGQTYGMLSDSGLTDSPTYFGVDVDVTNMNVNTSTAGVATFRYRNPSGSGDYSTASATIAMYDSAVKLAKQAGTSDSMMIAAGSYRPNVLKTISSLATVDSGVSTQSTYGLAWDATSQAWYFAGYPTTFYRYTPANAWNVTPGNTITECSSASPTNPCSANGNNLKYPYWALVGSDGLIYSVDYDERSGATGGGIKWYNPTTHATSAYRAGPPSLECFTPHGAATLSAGATIAYSGNAKTDAGAGCAETEGHIFLFDVATKAITDTLTPIEGAADPGTLTALPNGHLMGVVNDYPTSADYTIYSIDPATGTVDWSITGVGTVGSGTTGAPAVGPDGYVYLYIGNNLTRLHPLTGATETAYADSTSHGGMSLVTGPFGNAMYLWGSTHLYRINLWRPAALRVKNSQSTATQIKLLYGRTTTLDATSQTVACAYNADCYVPIPGHVIGDMYYQWQFLTAGGAVTAASDITKVTIN